MLQRTVRRTATTLCVIVLMGFSSAPGADAAIHKTVGETSVAHASCAQGCDLAMRIKKGETVVKGDVASDVPWTWLEAWGTGTFILDCKCGDSGWSTIATYEVVDHDLPIVAEISFEQSPISVWLPENFPPGDTDLMVWTYPHPDVYCFPWVWTNATLHYPKTNPFDCSEAYVSGTLGTRMVTVTAYLNEQNCGYGERQVTMAEQISMTGLGGEPQEWKPSELVDRLVQTTTDNELEHFEFSTEVTTTVYEHESGDATFSTSGAENDTIPAQMTAEMDYGLYDIRPAGGGDPDDSVELAVENEVDYIVESTRTLTDNCSLSLDVAANKQLTVFLGPQGDKRSGDYVYYFDMNCAGGAESKDEGTYEAVKVSGVYLDYTISECLP